MPRIHEIGPSAYSLRLVCSIIDITFLVNGGACMDFKKATDALFSRVSHADLAARMGVSVAMIRQARLRTDAQSHRAPPADWRDAVIRMAEVQIMRCRQLIEDVRRESGKAA
jgi:hypothetical protein